MLKIFTIVGTRPQFIKAAAVSRVINEKYIGKIEESIVHTGQHHDDNMSLVFFNELNIPRPKYNLGISGGSHGVMTGRMLEAIENLLLSQRPDWVLVYGDTNSTLAGALAAVKAHIPVAHIEAGLRSFNRCMPEEINRIVTDRVSTLLFCPTERAVALLQGEGIIEGVHNIGDVMYDISLFYREHARKHSKCLEQLGLQEGVFALVTCHRAENTDDPKRLTEIVAAIGRIADNFPVVFPIHPRTHKLLNDYGITHLLGSTRILEPLSFLDMMALGQAAKVILTDSGGLQKEAFFYGVPCITMRDETEWMETVITGANVLVGSSAEKIFSAYIQASMRNTVETGKPYGDGNAAGKIVSILAR